MHQESRAIVSRIWGLIYLYQGLCCHLVFHAKCQVTEAHMSDSYLMSQQVHLNPENTI